MFPVTPRWEGEGFKDGVGGVDARNGPIEITENLGR